MSVFYVVWDQHGDGDLIGVFDEDETEKIMAEAKAKGEAGYIRKYKAKLNHRLRNI